MVWDLMEARYTLTYTPSADRILPSPSQLHLKIRNTTSVAFRAAYLHGPYTIHAAAYPASFDPNHKVEDAVGEGTPQFEPNVKPGGAWGATLTIPEAIRESGVPTSGKWPTQDDPKSVTWVIEITSQIIFSHSASVNFELLVARDERSLDLGFLAVGKNSQSTPGQIKDHQHAHHPNRLKGVYSKAVELVVDDTLSLWNKPQLPVWESEEKPQQRKSSDKTSRKSADSHRKKQKVHLVILTHGLHSNLGADMLYLKESIDAAAKEARENARARKREEYTTKQSGMQPSSGAQTSEATYSGESSTAPLSGGQEDIVNNQEDSADEDDEMVVVRGFPGNVVRTERGIQYLGKRLAKYVLETTHPDQPYLPIKKSMSQKLSNTFTQPSKPPPDEGLPVHSHSSVHLPKTTHEDRAYQFTSISFIGHSLGGLVQTYAIAYIQKHCPQFFDLITPVNFVALASPFLGLSNENPLYVKMALEIGVVGRTGQDLGLTWTTPTVVRNGWSAMLSGLGQKETKPEDPRAKPLLRILPTGPAHKVLRRFRNRTVYSNAVNDGIVPLRTGCLLFLDWRGLGKVEKARRENGLIGTVAEWGWSNLTGQNTSPHPSNPNLQRNQTMTPKRGYESPPTRADDSAVPQPGDDATNEDDKAGAANVTTPGEPEPHQFLSSPPGEGSGSASPTNQSRHPILHTANTLSKFLSFLQPSGAHTAKDNKMFRRSQTVLSDQSSTESDLQPESTSAQGSERQQIKRPTATRGDSIGEDPNSSHLAPPKTTIFESAGDLLNPPVPPHSWIIDPGSRARTIFHDRVYHPEDIPPPPTKRNNRFGRSFSSQGSQDSSSTIRTDDGAGQESGGMRVEEKIARAYHKDMSWRKVLVRLEPDAHNNIIVRRMFANAYGWPVIKHLCDTHFADTYTARTRDELEPATERAKKLDEEANKAGEEVAGQAEYSSPLVSPTELRETPDELTPVASPAEPSSPRDIRPGVARQDTSLWDDSYFDVTSESEDEEFDDRMPFQKFLGPAPKSKKNRTEGPSSPKSPTAKKGTSEAEIADFLSSAPLEGHRGLTPTSPVVTAGKRSFSSSTPKPDSSEQPEPAVAINASPENPPNTQRTTSEVGLRKSIVGANQSPIAAEGTEAHDISVSEQIARISSSQETSP